MEFESALALKQELLSYLSTRPSAVPFGTSIGPGHNRADQTGVPMSLGIGADPGGRAGGFVLGVIVPTRQMADGPDIAVVRERARGECQVVVGGRARPLVGWHLGATTPLRIGASVGHTDVTAGTLGCFVRSRTSGQTGFLSNNHVLANSNRARPGDSILQPAPADGGQPDDIVGTLAEIEALVWNRQGENAFDAAWARFLRRAPQIDGRSLIDTGGAQIGRLSTSVPAPVLPGENVVKIGRSSGCTYGRVLFVNTDDVHVPYGSKVAVFADQIVIEPRNRLPFAVGGDSGSLVVTEGFVPAGLLFAGSETGGSQNLGLTYVSPIAKVLDKFGLDILLE